MHPLLESLLTIIEVIVVFNCVHPSGLSGVPIYRGAALFLCDQGKTAKKARENAKK